MKTIIIAPHPDDEVLGVGGTILRHKAEGSKVAWLIVTGLSIEDGWEERVVKQRSVEIKQVKEFFHFDSVYELNYPSRMLDAIPIGLIIESISKVFIDFQPSEVYLPHRSDIHTDHRIVFDAVASCTKWFRHPYIKKIMAYETLSETDFSLVASQAFRPNTFVDISLFLEEKIRAMDIYISEVGTFPFPRSHDAIRALATLRGSASGFPAAESFEMLKERI